MAKALSVLVFACFVIELATILLTVTYSLNLAQHGSAVADIATGQIVAIRNKTQILYVTQSQIDKLYALLAVNAGLTIATTILFLLRRRSA